VMMRKAALVMLKQVVMRKAAVVMLNEVMVRQTEAVNTVTVFKLR